MEGLWNLALYGKVWSRIFSTRSSWTANSLLLKWFRGPGSGQIPVLCSWVEKLIPGVVWGQNLLFYACSGCTACGFVQLSLENKYLVSNRIGPVWGWFYAYRLSSQLSWKTEMTFSLDCPSATCFISHLHYLPQICWKSFQGTSKS